MKLIKRIVRWVFWLTVWPVACLLSRWSPFLLSGVRGAMALSGFVMWGSCILLIYGFEPIAVMGWWSALSAVASLLVLLLCYFFIYLIFVHQREKYIDKSIKPMSRLRIWWDDAVVVKVIRLGRRISDRVTDRKWKKVKLRTDEKWLNAIIGEYGVSRRRAFMIMDQQIREMARRANARMAAETW